jgi:hypothetical protein
LRALKASHSGLGQPIREYEQKVTRIQPNFLVNVGLYKQGEQRREAMFQAFQVVSPPQQGRLVPCATVGQQTLRCIQAGQEQGRDSVLCDGHPKGLQVV